MTTSPSLATVSRIRWTSSSHLHAATKKAMPLLSSIQYSAWILCHSRRPAGPSPAGALGGLCLGGRLVLEGSENKFFISFYSILRALCRFHARQFRTGRGATTPTPVHPATLPRHSSVSHLGTPSSNGSCFPPKRHYTEATFRYQAKQLDFG